MKSPPFAAGVEGITVPGEPERRHQRERELTGIPLDDATWQQIVDAGQSVGVPPMEV